MHRRAAALLAALLFLSVHAHAHRPIAIGDVAATPDQAFEVTEIDVSQVVYAPLTETAPQLWLTFEVAEPARLRLSLGTPFLDRLRDYRPSIAVLGPGLPPIELPFAVPAVDGGFAFRGAAPANENRFFEPFTETESWITVAETVELPKAGRYYVVAWAPAREADKLWVALGFLERFGIRDILTLGSIIREVRAFHEVGPREPFVSWETLVVLGVILGILGTVRDRG